MTTLLAAACHSKDNKSAPRDTATSGQITISVDESFKPVMEEEVKVFESQYVHAKINTMYKPEADCIKDLWNDSVRMIISTIKLTQPEQKKLADSMNVLVSQLSIARDAVAVIVNNSAPDSLFSMADIRAILSGTKPYVPVFDGVNATSTVRYMIDSVLKGQALTPKAVAARTSDSVINYVATHPLAVGFIGVSWIGNPEDGEQLSFLKKVRIAHLESNDIAGKYILPVQANIYTSRYPMTRDLVFILKEKYNGLGYGFSNFLGDQIGQLIFKRAYLMPGRKNFIIRQAQY